MNITVTSVLTCVMTILLTSTTSFALELKKPTTPSEALTRLMEGNQRFVENNRVCSNNNQERRTETADKQTPFAVVVGCSDSRVPPELAFDQGLGDIFVVRIAGNVASPIEIDSIEYSIEHNQSCLILVMGHENCGAVEAVYNNNDKDIPSISKIMKPTIEKVKTLKTHTLEDAVIANVRNSVSRITASPVIGQFLKDKKIQIHGAYYHLESGKVTILPD